MGRSRNGRVRNGRSRIGRSRNGTSTKLTNGQRQGGDLMLFTMCLLYTNFSHLTIFL
jgi:hypothetical protein